MKKLKVGIIGLGRLGIYHAHNIAFRIPNTTLFAACDVNQNQLDILKNDWGIPYIYREYDEMLENKEIDIIFIVSPTAMHVEHIQKALEAGFHVFSEKPLSMDLEKCYEAIQIVNKYPKQKFTLGFMRRFDPSYRYAYEKIKSGLIGKPVVFKSFSQDGRHTIDSVLKFIPSSGGEFIDVAVHDIDLARWFLGVDPIQVWALGDAYVYPEFKKYNDGDIACATLRFENEAVAFLLAGRLSPHGYQIETEIIGTEGILRVGAVPQKNLVEILDGHGVRRECYEGFLERFDESYRMEVEAFVNSILEDKKPEVSVEDGSKVTQIAYFCRESFEKRKLIDIKLKV